jgi:chitodextrinase
MMVSVSWSRVPKTCKAVVTSPWAGDPCQDWTPPAGVHDLRVVGVTRSSVTLAWTAPGDDGTSGNASFSDIRLATMDFDEETWDDAVDVQGEPSPPGAGETATVIVGGLTPTTRYWFAVKTGDEIPNWSAISNVVDTTTSDEPEAMIWDLSFAVSQCTLEQFGCSPQGCICPPPNTVYGFCPNRRLNVWGMRMESDGDNLTGSMTVSNATIGSYILRSGTVAVTASIHGGRASYELTITGLLDDPFLEPAQNPFAQLDCAFSVTDAVLDGNRITGVFSFAYNVDSLAGSCLNLHYREEGWGTSSVNTQMAPAGNVGILVSSGP